MGDISININGKKGRASPLQIDCDLDAPTSITSNTSNTSAWSTRTTPFTTPKADRVGNISGGSSSSSHDNNNNNEDLSSEWKELYKQLDMSPPKAARTARYDETVQTANNLLKLSDESDFQDKSFQDLTNEQQAILMFMVMKGMHEIFEGGHQTSAKVLINALRPESKEYKRMRSFVLKGGDSLCRTESLLYKKFSKYAGLLPEVSKHDWLAENVTTIFKRCPKMRPFLHLQREYSYICTFNACSALLYYCSHKNQLENDNESVSRSIKMNISRYIRDEVPGLEIANFTLTTEKGAVLEKVLSGLLKSFGTANCNSDVKKIDTWGQDEATNFFQLKAYLHIGRPFVFGIECFPGLMDKTRFKYTGKVADYYSCGTNNQRPKNPSERRYHALLCVGIAPRNGSRPPMLLVQDSCSSRPVFEIGLDLLMDLGIENSTPCTVPEGWESNENMDYTVSLETKALFCGSPMALDDKGVPRIINTKPKEVQRRDMSRYLQEVIAKPGDIIVYMS